MQLADNKYYGANTMHGSVKKKSFIRV